MVEVYIHAPTISQFGKTDHSYFSLSYDTAKASIEASKIRNFDFFVFGAFSPDSYTGELHLAPRLAIALGLQNAFVCRTDSASSAGALAFQIGVNLILSGRHQTGLIVSTEIMSQLDGEKNNLLLGGVLSQEQINLAMSMAQGGAMITNRYLNDYGYDKKDLFYLSKKLHDNGLKNQKAQIKKNLDFDTYLNQPMIADPLGLFDISPLSDGSAALVLSKEKSSVAVRGMGHGLGAFLPDGRPSFPASVKSFQMAYEQARVAPNQIQMAELHDAFTPFELILAEDAELIPRGKALKFLKDGLTKVLINESGGLKSRGHPVGASGLAQIVELANRMVESKIQWGMTHSIGGLATQNFTQILEMVE